MLPFEDRYSRQRRLPEVGVRGQLALEQASPVLSVHAGSQIEQEYLTRSGVVHAKVSSSRSPCRFAHEDWFQFSPTLRIAQGASGALQHIEAILSQVKSGKLPGEGEMT